MPETRKKCAGCGLQWGTEYPFESSVRERVSGDARCNDCFDQWQRERPTPRATAANVCGRMTADHTRLPCSLPARHMEPCDFRPRATAGEPTATTLCECGHAESMHRLDRSCCTVYCTCREFRAPASAPPEPTPPRCATCTAALRESEKFPGEWYCIEYGCPQNGVMQPRAAAPEARDEPSEERISDERLAEIRQQIADGWSCQRSEMRSLLHEVLSSRTELAALHRERETDAALGKALRDALATVPNREQLKIERVDDDFHVWREGPFQNDATRALKAALLAPRPVAVRDDTTNQG